MLQELWARPSDTGQRDEDGFTLIELMVVVLIIAILIGIAIPTFLGARQKAQDRAAQSALRNALTTVRTAYVDSQNYSADAADGAWASIEPSLDWVSGPSTTSARISTHAIATDTVILADYSASGRCWYMKDSTGATGQDNAGTYYATGPAVGEQCSATDSVTFTVTPTDPNNHW
jgi:type IV pilus assembly protein PilA